MKWNLYFAKERTVRRLLRAASVARPRIKALAASLMTRRPAGAPGLLPPAQAARALAAYVPGALAADIVKLRALVSPTAQPIGDADLARMKDALK
jgi:hypothetical protein